MKALRAPHPGRPQPPAERPLRRFRPRYGQLLTLANIRGPWRPSGAVCASGVFAVCWSTHNGNWWAAVHDFAPADQLRLVEMCRSLDHEQFGGAV